MEAFRHRCGAWSSKPMYGSDVVGRFDPCTLPPLLNKTTERASSVFLFQKKGPDKNSYMKIKQSISLLRGEKMVHFVGRH